MEVGRRGLLFLTFVASCLAAALTAAALSTQHWVAARALRVPNPHDSDGRLHIGLFRGRKELNVAYGWRARDIDVVSLVQEENGLLDIGLWSATIACVGGGLLLAVVAAIFAVLNAATNPVEAVTGIPGLYAWNILAALLDLIGISTWATEFHLRLKYNILSEEDRLNQWTSMDLAVLGYSFWFVVGAVLVHLLNITLIFVATHERKDQRLAKPKLEEKSNGAIMLY